MIILVYIHIQTISLKDVLKNEQVSENPNNE